MRVLCGVRLSSMGLRQEEDHIQPMEDDIKSRLCCAISVEHHEEIMLVACRPLLYQWTCEDVPKSGSPIVEYGGAIN